MIYLFEDKEGRKAKYIQGTIDDSVLKSAIMNCSRDELEAYINALVSGEKISDII